MLEGATIVGATDFLASDPDTPTFVAEKESEEGLTGSDLALVRFKNRLRFGAEGATIGAGNDEYATTTNHAPRRWNDGHGWYGKRL